MRTKVTNTNTIIKFRFKRPIGFRIGAYDANGKPINKEFGNFVPTMINVKIKVDGVDGDSWAQDYDYTQLHSVELDSELVRGLPAHIASHADENVRNAYLVEQAKEAAEAHHFNNAIRDELYKYEHEGVIEIVHDSFLDEKRTTVEDKPIEKLKK